MLARWSATCSTLLLVQMLLRGSLPSLSRLEAVANNSNRTTKWIPSRLLRKVGREVPERSVVLPSPDFVEAPGLARLTLDSGKQDNYDHPSHHFGPVVNANS